MLSNRAQATLMVTLAAAVACGGPTAPTASPPPSGAIGSPTPTLATATPGSGQTATPSAAPIVTASPTTPAAASATPTAASATATLAPPTLAPPSPTATPVTVATPTPAPTPGPVVIGDPAINAPDSVPADTVFYVNWVGPNNQGDYITIVAAGKRKWNGEPFFYTYGGTPRPLQSSTTPGNYEIWYVNGANGKPRLKVSITVTPFVGSLDGPPSVAAGTEFNVAWTGPASPGDYVTIEPVGATQWVNESFFYASSSTPTGTLTAPLTDGAHELWYVAGDKTVMLREPITVMPLSASVTGPASAAGGASFSVSWTGPNASGDFITIVAVGAEEGSYLSYAYTQYGNPATLTAPDTSGQYELRYVYGSTRQTIATASITIN